MKKDYLNCVICGVSPLVEKEGFTYCSNNDCYHFTTPFLKVNEKDVYVNFKESVLNEGQFTSSNGESVIKRVNSKLFKLRSSFRRPNRITERNFEFLKREIINYVEPKILVIGGGEIGNGLDWLYKEFSDHLISFDIYHSPLVTFIADAHKIPVKCDYFDVVIIQAVLEHVLEPNKVVSEIYRVMKLDGLLYAETPFIQHVHEGRFDYTRYTEVGHRYLFRRFDELSSGYNLGAATALLWSLDFFISGLCRTRLAGKFFRILFSWISFFDMMIPEAYNIDGASGVYFLGRKSSKIMSIDEIISHYKGNQ